MPWKNQSEQTPQWVFIEAVQRRIGPFALVCREHGISRQTGYKWWQRFQQDGLTGLIERSRRPHHCARGWPPWTRKMVAQIRRANPGWGAKKLRWILRQLWPRRRWPHPRTLERWAPRRPGRIRHPGPKLPALARAEAWRANEVWTIDFKGWFRTKDGTRIDPLTVRDLHSRQVLLVRHVPAASDAAVRRVLIGLFRRCGLPRVIRVDNGAPFGGCGALGLSTLSVWWLRLGVRVEFIRPAHPQDNGAHEQMHRVLKAETASPAAATAAAQHRRFQRWRHHYNQHRPHEALGLEVPAARYRLSRRRYPARLSVWHYQPGAEIYRVNASGRILWRGRSRFIGRAFAAERIALRTRQRYHEVYLGPHLIGELHQDDPGGLRPARRGKTSL
jgi:putative transposase